jgi:putative transposase
VPLQHCPVGFGRVLGGFKWSSQHLDRGGVDGQASGVDDGVDGPVGDEVAGAALIAPGGAAGVLA